MNNVISWFSVPTTDFERAVKFYETIFDIEMPRQEMPGGVNMAFFQESETVGVNGDINDSKDLKPNSGGMLIFFSANGKLEQVVDRVADAGGEVLEPKTDIGEWGFIAKVKDTEGNVFGVHSKT